MSASETPSLNSLLGLPSFQTASYQHEVRSDDVSIAYSAYRPFRRKGFNQDNNPIESQQPIRLTVLSDKTDKARKAELAKSQ